MKKVNEVLENRRSYREYNDTPIELDIIMDTLKLARRTATSVNGQQVSMIVTRDKAKLAEISELSWGQKHILGCDTFITFVVDYNRASGAINSQGKSMNFTNDLESILVGAVDAGLMAQSVEMLFQGQEIGTCMIGAIRGNMKKMHKLLNLSENTFAIFGLTVGNVDNFESTPLEIRPRANDESAIFLESYDSKAVYQSGVEYSEELSKWWESKGLLEHRSYAQSMAQFYENSYVSDLLETLQEMNFLKNFEKK